MKCNVTSHKMHYRSYRGWICYGSNDPNEQPSGHHGQTYYSTNLQKLPSTSTKDLWHTTQTRTRYVHYAKYSTLTFTAINTSVPVKTASTYTVTRLPCMLQLVQNSQLTVGDISKTFKPKNALFCWLQRLRYRQVDPAWCRLALSQHHHQKFISVMYSPPILPPLLSFPLLISC